MFFDLYGLYQEIINYDKIYIYGMGMYSDMIVPKLFDLGLRTKIAGYVISDSQLNNQFKESIPIYSIDNLHIDASVSLFLIATSSQYDREIENKLKSFNYDNYIFLSHYERNNSSSKDVYFRYKNTNFDQYCKYISEWYDYKYSERISKEYLENHQKIWEEFFKKKIKSLDTRNNKQIVFVVALLQPRINKIIKALVGKGYEIVILNLDKLTYPYARYEEKNIRVVYCEYIEEVLFEAINLNPLLFYVRPALRDSSVANIMLMQKDFYGKIVLDIHDIIKGCFNLPPEYQWLYDIEKDALESADGVVWRYDAENFLKEKYGYQYRGKSIHFWDYCYDEFIFNEPESDVVLKLCCIESCVEFLKVPNDEELSRESIVRYANLYDILDKIGNRNDCEFSIYVSIVSEKELKELKRLKEEYANFNFYVGYSPKNIIQDISKCDYGCSLYRTGRIPTDIECIEKGYYMLPGAYEMSATNRHFDFLNAGIPIVASLIDCRKQHEFLKEYDVIVDMDLESLDIEYLKAKKYLYRENVKAAKKHLSISPQIDRLIDFFNSI